MKASIVTVCHNSKERIQTYVSSFLEHHFQRMGTVKYEFVFVENSGQPEIREVVRPLSEAGHDVLVIDSENEGFGAGCNLGARHSTGDILVFANPDLHFQNSLDLLVKFSARPSWGTVVQLTPQGKAHSVDLFPEHKNLLFELVKGYRLVNRYAEHFLSKCYVVGSFLVVERTLFKRCGGFDTQFFLYYEEAELCRRLQIIGGPPFVERSISVMHEGFGSQTSHDHTLMHEAEGFLTYCRTTSQVDLLQERLRQLWLLSLLSSTAKRRYAILRAKCDEINK